MDNETKSIADKLFREMAAWKSMHVIVKQKLDDYPQAMSFASKHTMVFEYTETTLGQRYMDMKAFADGKQNLRAQMYFDGKRGSSIQWDNNDASKQTIASFGSKSFAREFNSPDTERPKPFYYLYTGKKPLYESLKTADHQGSTEWNGYQTELFSFPNMMIDKLTGTMVYYLDKSTGWPVQIVFWTTPEQRKWVWQAKSLDAIDGFHYPRDSVFEDVSHAGESLKIHWTVDTIEYNKKFDDIYFVANPQPEAKVFGKAKTNIKSQPPTPIRTENVESSSTKSESPVVGPVKALESDWSATLPIFLVISGLLVVIGGLVLRNRG